MIIELRTASYKGVNFIFDELTTTGGNRIIKHRHPGSGKQSIEVQGEIPKTYNIKIVIPHDDYYVKRDGLLKVLSDGESGVLIHPTFGSIDNVKSGQYNLSEKPTALGKGVIDVTFEIDDVSALPSESVNLPAQVALKSEELNSVSVDTLADNYSVDVNNSGNFSDALESLGDIPNLFNEASEFSEPISSSLNEVRLQIDRFSDQIGSLINSPADLSRSLNDMFDSVSRLYNTPSEVLGAMNLLFKFGDDDIEIQNNTVARIERIKNRNKLNAMVKLQSLSYSLVVSTLIDYQNSDVLNDTVNALENNYLSLRDLDIISDEEKELLDDLRVQAYKVLDVVSVNTRSVLTIETTSKPLAVLCYEYYGSTDLFDTLAELNNIKQNAFVSGQIKVLTL